MGVAAQTVAVTGATGFLGGYLVDALLDHGARVVAVVRNPDKARPLAERGVDVRRADLAERDALARGFEGVDAVISNAAAVSFTRAAETLATNVQGTRNVFDAMADAGVGRAVAVSSTVVYPMSRRRVDESTAIRDTRRATRLNGYAVSKASAEKAAWELAERHGIALTTVRPCAITGPGDPLLMRAFRTLMRVPLVTPYPFFTTVGIAHGRDVAEAIVLALDKPEVSAGKAYNLAGNTLRLDQLPRPWRRAGGHAPWLLPVPVPVRMDFDDTRARTELGWCPRPVRTILEDVLAHTS